MSNIIEKINIGGIDHELVDTQARADISEIKTNAGSSNLTTTEKTYTGAINELNENLSNLQTQMQSFEDTKADIVGSGLGTALGMSTDDTWDDVVADIEGVPVLDGIYSMNNNVDSNGNIIPRLAYGNIQEVVEAFNPDTGYSVGNVFKYTSPKQGYLKQGMPIYGFLAGLTPSNIKSGVKIGNPDTEGAYITGTFGSDATLASAANLAKGVIAYGKNGVKYTGTYVPTSSVKTKTLTASLVAESTGTGVDYTDSWQGSTTQNASRCQITINYGVTANKVLGIYGASTYANHWGFIWTAAKPDVCVSCIGAASAAPEFCLAEVGTTSAHLWLDGGSDAANHPEYSITIIYI